MCAASLRMCCFTLTLKTLKSNLLERLRFSGSLPSLASLFLAQYIFFPILWTNLRNKKVYWTWIRIILRNPKTLTNCTARTLSDLNTLTTFGKTCEYFYRQQRRLIETYDALYIWNIVGQYIKQERRNTASWGTHHGLRERRAHVSNGDVLVVTYKLESQKSIHSRILERGLHTCH